MNSSLLGSGNKASGLINKFNATNKTSNFTSGFNVNQPKETKPINLINKLPNSVIESHVKEEPKPKTKTKEEIEEEKKLKREKMKLKMGNSTKKLVAKKEEEKKQEAEAKANTQNINDNVKIKSLANMFEGKIGVNPMKKPDEQKSSNVMGDRLNKLYGGGVQQEKEVEVDDDEEINNVNRQRNANTICINNSSVERRITVTKLTPEEEKEKELAALKRGDSIEIEESKPRTMTQVKKFKKPNFKLDK